MKRSLGKFHPGEFLLEDFLIPGAISQSALARALGWTHAKVNEIIHGRRGVTAEAAWDLSGALGTTPELWMNMQSAWDLDKARRGRGRSGKKPGRIARVLGLRPTRGSSARRPAFVGRRA